MATCKAGPLLKWPVAASLFQPLDSTPPHPPSPFSATTRVRPYLVSKVSCIHPLEVRPPGIVSRDFAVVLTLLLETVHAALRPLASTSPLGQTSLYGFMGLRGVKVKDFGASLSLSCFPSCVCISFCSSASWTAIEHSLLKLGEILANLSSPQLRSQAEQCGTLIRRYSAPRVIVVEGERKGWSVGETL